MLYLPILCILVLICVKIGQWLKEVSKQYSMKVKLANMGIKIYDTKFNFREILPGLSIQFFRLCLNEQETKFLKDNFSIIVDEETSISIQEQVCSICTDEYQKGDCVTTLPICNHQFHDKCVFPWLTQQKSTCPNCRELVRVKM